MEERNNHQFVPFFIILLCLLFAGVTSYILVQAAGKLSNTVESPIPLVTSTPNVVLTDYISYQGKVGKSALQLLKEQAAVDEEPAGFVIAINGRKADVSEREYWAFYVNGKLAQTGASDYQTKEEDKVEWKIEKY